MLNNVINTFEEEDTLTSTSIHPHIKHKNRKTIPRPTTYHATPSGTTVEGLPRFDDLNHIELVVVLVVFNVGLVEHAVVVLVHLYNTRPGGDTYNTL